MQNDDTENLRSSDCSSAIPGVNDQEQWNAGIQEMQDDVDFGPLKVFLEKLKEPIRVAKDRDWSKYPIGTKAHAFNGGHWIRVECGWKWFNGSTFPTPGGDAIGKCIEFPPTFQLSDDLPGSY